MFEIEEKAGELLGSQRAWLYDPASTKMLAAGWRSGKTRILCVHGLLCSAAIPGNRGLIGRYTATDLEDWVIPMFFEVCPPSWIKKYVQDKGRKAVILRNNSVIYFRHIHDPNPKRSHLAGGSLGWAGIDQCEELTESDYLKIAGRLSLGAAQKRFLFANMNPNGKDWIYRMFFAGMLKPWRHGEWYQTCRQGNRLGIVSRNEENRRSNGGFVDDSYFDMLRESYPPEWVARYLDASFEDFSGKIYREYNLGSVHNIPSFNVSEEWPIVVSIDVGGQHPWAVLATATTPDGCAVTYKEFHRGGPTVKIRDVANWIKANLPWASRRIRYIIDPENKPVAIELADYGIHATPAIKHVNAGIERVKSYIHPRRNRTIPAWIMDNFAREDETFIRRLREEGVPSWYIVKSQCPNTARQLDAYVYDENKNKPKKEDDDGPDSLRYGLMSLPSPPKIEPADERREALLARDPGTVRAWDDIARFWKGVEDERAGRLTAQEAFALETPQPTRVVDSGNFEW